MSGGELLLPLVPEPHEPDRTAASPAALTPSAPPKQNSITASSPRKRRPPALTLSPKAPSPVADENAEHTLGSRQVLGERPPSPKAHSTPQTSAGSTSSAGNVIFPCTPSSGGELEIHGMEELSKLGKLGQGSSGLVELHQHVRTGREVALKMVSVAEISQAQQKAVLLELRTFATCRNPHIVDFYGAFQQDNTIHIALEYMNAGALSDVLEVHKTVPEAELANITGQVLAGLEYLHREMRVIHRDVKPSNLVLNTRGAVKITDFGVSGELQDELAQSGNKHTWVGTIYYMSPERVLGEPYKYDSDLWSLGLTIFECLSGRYPYTGQEKSAGKTKELSLWQLMRCVVEQEAPQLPADSDFTPQARAFLGATLQKLPKRRPSATALRAHAWLDGATTPPRQAAVAAWIAGAGLDRAAPSSGHSHMAPQPMAAGLPPMLAHPDPGLSGTPAMGTSLRGGGNPFAKAAGPSSTPAQTDADTGASQARLAGGVGRGRPPVLRSGVRCQPAPRGTSPSSKEDLLGAAVLGRWPDVAEREALEESDLGRWEATVHRIVSAFQPEQQGAAGGEGGRLPCRVPAAGFGLFLGDAASARDVEALEALSISAVMNCGATCIAYPSHFAHLEVHCEDAEGYPLLARHLDECVSFAESCKAKGSSLLVHCIMGLNRSPALLVALLMLLQGEGLSDAVRCVWESRGRLPILTNRSFRRQLVQLAHLTGHLR